MSDSLEFPQSDAARTRDLCFQKLKDADEHLLPEYPVVRDGAEMLVPRDALTLEERRIIADALREMGEAKLREANRLLALARRKRGSR